MMNDNEIIKALECCLDISPSTCKNCPLFNATNSTMVCSKIATKFALDLINRQKAEIERYNKIFVDFNANITDLIFQKEKVKSEAIKEFAERLKEKMHSGITMSGESVLSIHPRGIDNLVKELIERQI